MRYPDIASLILRLGFGLYMILGHGLGKFQSLISGEEIQFFSFLGLSPTISLALAVFGEFIACIFIVIGYKTRWATIPVIITLLVAVLLVHGGDPFFMKNAENGSKEFAMIYLFGFLAIYFLGSGKYSLDDKLRGRIL